MQLLERVHEIVPEGADVVFVGDREFDGIRSREERSALNNSFTRGSDFKVQTSTLKEMQKCPTQAAT